MKLGHIVSTSNISIIRASKKPPAQLKTLTSIQSISPKSKIRKKFQENPNSESEIEGRERMSGACSIPFVKIPSSSSSPSSSASASASASSSSSAHLSIRFSSSRPFVFTIRSSQTEGPLRRPAAPSLREPSPPSPPSPLKPTPPSQSPPPPPTAPVSQPSKPSYAAKEDNVITLEFQRQKAKELQEYFKQKKLEEADQGPFFGFIGKNEIANGRWAMFGFAVGMLTEYATGSNFVDQVKILLSNFGIVDIE